MCELFAMASRFPAHVTFSFEAFARRGGLSAPHRDGWGVAFYDGSDVQLVREPRAAADSPTVRFLQAHPLRSSCVISHIRLATHGGTSLSNTQPLVRELAGRRHVFAHNGHVPGVFDDDRFVMGAYRPVGATDSEYAFCALLERLAPLYERDESPSLARRRDVVSGFARDLAPHGPANFLYADGDTLFAHGHRRTQPDKVIRAPGLHVLCRTCHEPAVNGAVSVEVTSAEQRVVLFASVPLTDEPWRPLGEGELLTVSGGVLELTRQTRAGSSTDLSASNR
jgi:predicted glutamine amidotransferase